MEYCIHDDCANTVPCEVHKIKRICELYQMLKLQVAQENNVLRRKDWEKLLENLPETNKRSRCKVDYKVPRFIREFLVLHKCLMTVHRTEISGSCGYPSDAYDYCSCEICNQVIVLTYTLIKLV
jgi:hypothetical protein